MKKVLHVSYGGLGFGGVSSVIFSIVEPLFTKFDFGCVVFQKKCEREGEFEKYGKIHRIKCYSGKFFEKIFRNFIMYKGIYKICKENKYDVIHVHNQSDAGIVLKAAAKAGVKNRIVHSHNTTSTKKQSFFKKLMASKNLKLINKYSTAKVGCSKKACDDFFKADDCSVIYNSIDLNKFNLNLRVPHEGVRFIHVGRFCAQKNQQFLLKVFNEVRKTIKNATLKLIGFGEDEELLKSQIKNLGLEGCVELTTGNNDFVAKSFYQSDYMIFPSKFEGFGIVLLEAQASGCFCFVSNEIQSEADCGLIKKISLSKDEKTWADIIIEQIKSFNVNYSGLNNKLKAYDKGEIAKEYAKLYEI